MSHEAVLWALRQPVRPAERFVLMMLGDRSNHEGVCWPGYQNLSQVTGYSVRTVQRCIAALEAQGLIDIDARRAESGRSTSNLYRLRLDRGVPLQAITAREGRWRARRLGAEVLSEDDAGGEGDNVTPYPGEPPEAVDNAVRNPLDLSTGVTGCLGEGDNVTPSEGDRLSPLEDHSNQDPLTNHGGKTTSGAVEKAHTAVNRGDAHTLTAPHGAPAGSSPRDRLDRLDQQLRKRFGKQWRVRLRRSTAAYLDALRLGSDADFRRACAEAQMADTPPGPYRLSLLLLEQEQHRDDGAPAAIPESVGKAAFDAFRAAQRGRDE